MVPDAFPRRRTDEASPEEWVRRWCFRFRTIGRYAREHRAHRPSVAHGGGEVVPRVEVAVPFQDNWYFDTVRDGVVRRLASIGADAVVRVTTAAPGEAGRGRITDRFDEALGDEDC